MNFLFYLLVLALFDAPHEIKKIVLESPKCICTFVLEALKETTLSFFQVCIFIIQIFSRVNEGEEIYYTSRLKFGMLFSMVEQKWSVKIISIALL